MTDKISIYPALLQQALDALSCTNENDDPGHRCGHCDDYVDRNGIVRAALRAALSAPQPAQEPVAWVDERAIGWLASRPSSASVTITTKLAAARSLERPMPVYTTPQAPQPLTITDEQCDIAIRESGLAYLSGVSGVNRALLIGLCRAAIGITKGPAA